MKHFHLSFLISHFSFSLHSLALPCTPLLLLILTLHLSPFTLLASCSKDDDKPEPEAEILAFEPLLEWGCNIADVEQHIQSKEWWQNGNDSLEYWGDPFESWHKWYYVDSANMLTEQYLFETEDGQNLRYAISICWNNTVPAEKFKNTLVHQGFHATRVMVEFNDETFERYLSADGQTEALYNTDENGYSQALYRPVK